jgi:hypothetical protein
MADDVKMTLAECTALNTLFGDPDVAFIPGIYGGAKLGICSHSSATGGVLFVDTLTTAWQTANQCLYAAPTYIRCLCQFASPVTPPASPPPQTPPAPSSPAPSPPLPATPPTEAEASIMPVFWYVTLGGVGFGMMTLLFCVRACLFGGRPGYKLPPQQPLPQRVVLPRPQQRTPRRLPLV